MPELHRGFVPATSEIVTPVKLRAVDRHTMVRGRFNPFIVNPDWLKEQGIWTGGQVQMNLGALFEGLNFGSVENKTEWLIDNRAMIIKSLEEDCGGLAARVIQELPHTPIAAVGNNFTYAVTGVDLGFVEPVLGGRGRAAFDGVFKFATLGWQAVIPIEGDASGGQISVSVTQQEDDLFVVFNFHRDTSNVHAKAVSAAKNFLADEEKSQELAKLLLEQSGA